MTHERGAEILNQRQHRFRNDWFWRDNHRGGIEFVASRKQWGGGFVEQLSAFEAIAIAEKYERESK